METQLDRYTRMAIQISGAYLMMTFLSWYNVILLCATILVILLNFSISLTCLFSRGKITSGIIILNLLQLFLFCGLFMQIHNVLGPGHYLYSRPPCWYDWIELMAVHALRAIDLLDVLEAYGIRIQNVSNQSALSGIALLGMHIMVDIFILGAVLNAVGRRTSAGGKNRLVSLIEEFTEFMMLPVNIRHWVLLALTGLMCIAGYIEDCVQSLNIPRNWLLYPLDNILRTLDFGDAFQIFGWRLHTLDMGAEMATLSVYYRLLVASYTIALVNRVYLRFLEGQGKTVEELTHICISPGYSQDERIIALKALEKFGPYTDTVISRLAELLTVPKTYRVSAAMLSEIGSPGIPHIVKFLANKDKNIRRNITGLLERIDPWWHQSQGAREAIPCLAKALTDPDTETRFSILEALGDIDSEWPRSEEARTAVPHLIKALGHHNPNVRIAAASALEIIGPGARRAIFWLVKLLADKETMVRQAALDALKQIDPRWPGAESAQNTIPYFVKLLTHSHPGFRDTAARILRTLNPGWPLTPGAHSAVPHLMKSLTDRKSDVRDAAKAALDRIDPRGEFYN